MENSSKGLIVFGGIVVFAIGAVLGIIYQSQKQGSNPVVQKETINTLSSRTVQTIMAYGKVESIKGRNIAINYGGDKIIVNISPTAQVFSSIAKKDPKTGNLLTPTPEAINFSDIKIGDGVTITLKILENSQLEGEAIYILSSK